MQATRGRARCRLVDQRRGGWQWPARLPSGCTADGAPPPALPMQPAMGACGSKVQAWREEADEEWKGDKQLQAAEPAPPPQPQLRRPHDAPASYVPPLPPPPPKAGQEAGGMHRDPSGLFAFRKSQELSMGALLLGLAVAHVPVCPAACPSVAGCLPACCPGPTLTCFFTPFLCYTACSSPRAPPQVCATAPSACCRACLLPAALLPRVSCCSPAAHLCPIPWPLVLPLVHRLLSFQMGEWMVLCCCRALQEGGVLPRRRAAPLSDRPRPAGRPSVLYVML